MFKLATLIKMKTMFDVILLTIRTSTGFEWVLLNETSMGPYLVFQICLSKKIKESIKRF